MISSRSAQQAQQAKRDDGNVDALTASSTDGVAEDADNAMEAAGNLTEEIAIEDTDDIRGQVDRGEALQQDVGAEKSAGKASQVGVGIARVSGAAAAWRVKVGLPLYEVVLVQGLFEPIFSQFGHIRIENGQAPLCYLVCVSTL